MPLKTNQNNELLDLLAKEKRELYISQCVKKFKEEYPDKPQETIDKLEKLLKENNELSYSNINKEL